MIIITSVVLLIWLLTWVSWFFCLPGTKWFDDVIHDDDDDTYVLPIVGAILSVLALAGFVALQYYPADDNAPFGILVCVVAVSLAIWIGLFCMYCLTKVHANLRRKRNY